MEPPIIVHSNVDTNIFKTAEGVTDYLEPIDLLNEDYAAYDSKGRLLALVAEESRVVVRGGEDIPTHAETLRGIAREYLAALKAPPDWLNQASLGELVEQMVRHEYAHEWMYL